MPMTLGDIRRRDPWLWIYCTACNRARPIALAPLIIRWGPDAPLEQLRRQARCEACGAVGRATLKMRSWDAHRQEWQQWPLPKAETALELQGRDKDADDDEAGRHGLGANRTRHPHGR